MSSLVLAQLDSTRLGRTNYPDMYTAVNPAAGRFSTSCWEVTDLVARSLVRDLHFGSFSIRFLEIKEQEASRKTFFIEKSGFYFFIFDKEREIEREKNLDEKPK